MKIDIPGYRIVNIENIIMDFNGTIAIDGVMRDGVRRRIFKLAKQFHIYVLTSDTQGTAARELEGLPVTLKIFSSSNAGELKRQFVDGLGGDSCDCIGNGNNDRFMFETATLSIAVLETEGMFAPILMNANFLVKSSEDALDLLLDTKRLISGLRG